MPNLQDVLKDILVSVNEWLRFAEAKNGALLALNSGCAIGVSKLIVDTDACILVAGLGISLTLFLGSTAVCLVSFLPITKMPLIVGATDNDQAENILFFGSIARHNIDSYLDAISKCTESVASPPSKLDRLYAEQIIINSGIANSKYRCFKLAVWLTLTAVFTVSSALLLRFAISTIG